MKSNILKLLFILLLIFTVNKVIAYSEFDGNYTYNQYNPNGQYNIQNANSNEEVLFIVDFSGSMNSKMGYSPKAYLAVDALTSILRETQSSAKVGLRIFGRTNKPFVTQTSRGIALNKDNICTASELILPIARYNAERISNALSGINPKGGTPIGYSLRQAVQNDFSPGPQLKHIILISDGGENCGDNPCAFIRHIMSMRNDFKVDVIGITVDNNAYSQLSCIANAGHGNYYSVNSPEDFKNKFRQAFQNTPSRLQVQHSISSVVQSTNSTIPNNANRFIPVNIWNSPGIKYKSYGFQFEY